jgi:DNA invertase Pin-like site-specific DNA recombinase
VKGGCKNVFRGVHVSGAKTDRAQLRRVIEALEPDDVLIARLDRLARSTRDLLNTLAAITGKKAGFRSLGDAGGRHHDITREADADRAGWSLLNLSGILSVPAPEKAASGRKRAA